MAGTRAHPTTVTEVVKWLRTATPAELRTLAGEDVDAKKLLFVARKRMAANPDGDIKDLALEVDDILRRFGGEDAASGLP